MSITIREATVDEVIAVLEGIEEFDPVYSRSEVFERLQGRRYLALVAVEASHDCCCSSRRRGLAAKVSGRYG